MDKGYILSNKYRKAIFDELVAGETDINRIAKKHRIILKIAHRVVDDFTKGGVVEKQGEKYIFTKSGKKLVDSIGK